MNKNNKNLLTWLAIFTLFFILVNAFAPSTKHSSEIDFSSLLDQVESGNVMSVVIDNDLLSGILKTGQEFYTNLPYYPDLIKDLKDANVVINVSRDSLVKNSLLSAIISWLPLIVIVIVWLYLLKKVGKGSGNPLSFAKSKAKLLMDKDIKIRFKDVAGIDEAREELAEIVDFLRDPLKFSKLGGKIPKGCLLIGDPGTGKTLLAKAIAGESKVPFFSISGSDFVEMFVGVGASRVRDLFEQAKKHSPCIVFIDEIDAVGRHRGAGIGGGNDEREQTLNQLLVEMDGFNENQNIIVVAATNRPDVLDKALLRPGRFDRQITVPSPDINGREQILKVHSKKVPMAGDVDLKVIAKGTPGFVGADLANIINEAALHAARFNKKLITMFDFEFAKDKVMMGAERKSLVMKDEEKKLTAYHESGHAIITFYSPASDPIHKATIIPRGRALGMVMRLPEDDRYSMTREKLNADIAVAMGGRVAEELIFGYEKVTSGASSDIEHATKIAKAMVTKWGMSDEIGPILHEASNEEFISMDKANIIDEEVKKVVMLGFNTAQDLLKKHSKDLHKLAEALLKYETLTGEEIKELLTSKSFTKGKNDASSNYSSGRKTTL
jgi:cell division protease FtsH